MAKQFRNITRNLFIAFLILVFLAGFYFIYLNSQQSAINPSVAPIVTISSKTAMPTLGSSPIATTRPTIGSSKTAMPTLGSSSIATTHPTLGTTTHSTLGSSRANTAIPSPSPSPTGMVVPKIENISISQTDLSGGINITKVDIDLETTNKTESPTSLPTINGDADIENSTPSCMSEICPDMLIRQGNVLLLYNSQIPEIPGKNPLVFNTLDDYIYHIKVQRYKYGKYCPVLYLQQETNAQGDDVYRVRPGPFNQQSGLPTTMETGNGQIVELGQYFGGNLGKYVNPGFSGQINVIPFNAVSQNNTPVNVPYLDATTQNSPLYNQGMYGFDPTSQYVGKYTVLDQIHNSTKTQFPNTGLSTNPMDSNWAGAVFTITPETIANAASNAGFTPAASLTNQLSQVSFPLSGTQMPSPSPNKQ